MIKKLNWKLILLFFVALWFFDKGGEILGYLRNSLLAEQIRHAKGDTSPITGEGLTVSSITDLVLASGFASLIGLLVGLIISILICRRRKWHWANPILALVIVYLTGWLQIDGTNYIVQLLRMPGEIFNGIWYYLINGIVSISLGLLTFILISSMKRPNDNQHVTIKPQSA